MMKQRFTYQAFEGDARAVGEEEAKVIKANSPEAAEFFSRPLGNDRSRLSEAEEFLRMTDIWCPGLTGEIEGFASEMGTSPESVVWYTATIPRSGHCSHFAILPDRSASGHVLCGRSYEWGMDDECCVKTVRIAGQRAHTGFSVFCFGRYDGINDAGLWVSMSAGNPRPDGPLPSNRGFRFWALIRTILDRASSVEEAIDVASSFPLSFELSLIVADRGGHAAHIEKGPDYQAVRRERSGVLFAANHFLLPGPRDGQETVFAHSLWRERFLSPALSGNGYTEESVRGILDSELPNGLSARYYDEYFGTLWAAYADLSVGDFTVRFGPPSNGSRYESFRPSDPVGIRGFDVELVNEIAPAETWASVQR